MQRLILLRHGEAQPGGVLGVDQDRPLTAAGRAAAAAAGLALRDAGYTPDLALISPALRTRQTWEAARGAWPVIASREIAALYEASRRGVLALAEGQTARVVLVVAHNPGLQDLAAALSAGTQGDAGSASDAGFPPASTAVFDRTPTGWRLAFRHGEAAGA